MLLSTCVSLVQTAAGLEMLVHRRAFAWHVQGRPWLPFLTLQARKPNQTHHQPNTATLLQLHYNLLVCT